MRISDWISDVCSSDLPHFQALINNRPEDGIARSIALGIAAAHKRGVEAALIALADMPFVPIVHFQRLLAQYKGTGTLVASGVDGSRMPPARSEEYTSELQSLMRNSYADLCLKKKKEEYT